MLESNQSLLKSLIVLAPNPGHALLEGSAKLLKQRALLAADAGTKTETTLNRRKNRSHKKGRAEVRGASVEVRERELGKE